MHGGAEIELIELLEADPSAFGEPMAAAPRPPRPARPRPRWLAPAAIAAVLVIAVVAALVIRKPWVDEFQVGLAFPSARAVQPTLTEQLVFDVPPGPLSVASVGNGDSFELVDEAGGYVFAAPGASLNLGQGGSGGWAVFFATSVEDEAELESDPSASDVTVQGSPGLVTTAVGNQSIRVSFGPVNERIFTVVTSETSQEETLAFAEAVGFDDEVPTIDDISVLGELQPLCSLADFNSAYALVVRATAAEFDPPGVVSTLYGPESERFSLGSQAATPAGLGALRFVLGGEIDASVHGEPALTLDVNSSESQLAFGVDIGAVVAWVEGGRLVMVTGPVPVETLLVLADSVRPATDAEWAEVEQISG